MYLPNLSFLSFLCDLSSLSLSLPIRTSPSPRGSASYTGSSLRTPSNARDARDDIIRREEQRRDLMERRLGADPYYRDGSRQVGVVCCHW